MRLLRCVWRGTNKAAGRHCDASLRPPAIRMCDVKSLKLAKCAPGEDDLDNNTFQRKTTLSTSQKSEYSTLLQTTMSTPITKIIVASVFDNQYESYLTSEPLNYFINNTSIQEYSAWKKIQANTTPKSLLKTNLNMPIQKDLPVIVEPFKGWERWRGWRLYNWPQPQHDLRRLNNK